MKKVFMFGALALLTSSLSAKEVTVCTAYVVGTHAEMECSGGFTGKASMYDLYQKGWHYISDISGTNKFVLVFEK